MTDGLYLSGTWVATVDVALTYQVNDLTKPDTLQSSYSNSFQLPDTNAIRDLLEGAEQPDAGGVHPYRSLPARLIDGGEVIFSGIAKLQSFQGGWKVNLYESQKNIYEQLGAKKLRELDLSRFDHPWQAGAINELAGAASGVVYPLIDYGTLQGSEMASDTLFPAVYVHTLVEQMLREVNHRPVGPWLSDPLYKTLAVPFVDDQAQSRDQDWVDDRKARVTVPNEKKAYYWNLAFTMLPDGYNNIQARDLNIILPFTIDDDPAGYWSDGKLNNYKADRQRYVCDQAMRLQVQANIAFSTSVNYGAMEAILIAERNGVNAAQAYFSVEGPHNLTRTGRQELSLDEFIDCRAGDEVQIRLRIRKRTNVASFEYLLKLDQQTTTASFTPDPTVRPGDTWPVARNLPDLTCFDLLKTIALLMSGTYVVDTARRTVRLVRIQEIADSKADAIDWSTRVVENEEPELSVTLAPYAQRNLLKWKETDKISPFGNGVIASRAETLPAEITLLELPFAACLNSEKIVPGYGTPVLIQTRTLSGGTVNRSATAPRLIIVEPTKTAAITANGLNPDGALQKEPVTLTACFWAIRPEGAATPTNAYCLAFDPVAGQRTEQSLILRYFSTLRRILARPRQLTLPVYLSPLDVATLDLSLPIRFGKVRAGALVLNHSYWYLSRLQNYLPGQPCRAMLIPLDGVQPAPATRPTNPPRLPQI